LLCLHQGHAGGKTSLQQNPSVAEEELIKRLNEWKENVESKGMRVGAKLQATNRVPRPVDRGTATRYGG